MDAEIEGIYDAVRSNGQLVEILDGAIATMIANDSFPLGSIVAIVEMTDCFLMSSQPPKLVNPNQWEISIQEVDPLELAVGLWQPGRHAWRLENIQSISVPIPVKGHQGLWNVPNEILSQLQQAEV